MTNIFVYPQSVLIDSMKQKIVDLRSQMDEIKDEINGNEELGEKVTKVVEKKASPAEFSKYQLFTGELNKIIGLLLILTQRMHRYEMMLNDLDMSEEADRQQKVRNSEPFFFLSQESVDVFHFIYSQPSRGCVTLFVILLKGS